MLPQWFRPQRSCLGIATGAFTLLAVVFAGLSLAFAHEGHDHGEAKTPAAASALPRITVQSELYEVVGVLKDGRLTIYLDELATNEPVTDASLAVTIGEDEAIKAEPAEDGTYTVASSRFGGGGSLAIVFAVTARNGDDLLIGSLNLPKAGKPEASGVPAARWSTWAAGIPSPARNPAVLSLATFALGILFANLLRTRRVVPAVAAAVATTGVLAVLVGTAFGHEGHEHSHDNAAPAAIAVPVSDAPRRLPDGTVFVAKPTQRLLEVRTATARPETARRAVNLIGRVIADPNRSGLVQSINGGRVIALETGLPRIGQAIRKGEVLAKIEPTMPQADRTTISERMGEIEQMIAVAETKLRRIRQLAEKNVVPQSQVADAEIELEGLKRRREVMRQTRAEAEILYAPADGVISMAKVVPGQVVQAQDIMFQIVDPQALWVEALVFGEVDPTSLAEANAVWSSGQAVQLVYQGFSRALQQQASVVHFLIRNPPDKLNIGQPVTVIAKSGAPVAGLVMPRDAIVRSNNGEAIVWQHVEPERFVAKAVRTEPLDAARVVVVAGIREGERNVVRGADLVNQIC